MNDEINRPKTELKRSLGLGSLVFYGVGMILGAGIYSIVGKAAGLAGHSLWMSFLVAAITAALSALSYAELSTLVPKAGAEYAFLSFAFPRKRWLATTSGFMMFFSAAATAAAVSLAFAGYLAHFLNLPRELTAALLLFGFTSLNIYGIQESARLNTLFTLVEAFGLMVIVWLGVDSGFGSTIFSSPITKGVFPAASLVLFAFLGFENLVNFTEEARQPVRDIPKAILLSLGISTVLYMLVSVAAVSLVDPVDLAKSTAPLMDAAIARSVILGDLLGSIALFSTANTVLIALLAGSRILYGMAKGSAVPAVFARIHRKRSTPWLACLLVMAIALGLIPIGAVDVVASLASFATIVSFILVNVAVIALRFNRPHEHRAFKIPVCIGRFPVLPALAIVACGFLILEFQVEVYWLMGAFWFIGILLWVCINRFSFAVNWKPD
jgi:basic amino acid/polyamine antiporter, APA family